MPPRSPVRMTLDEVMAALEGAGNPQYAAIHRRNGAVGTVFGVAYAFLNPLAKKLRGDHALATALWETGIYDAMCFAPMIADPSVFTEDDAERWLRGVNCHPVAAAYSNLVGSSPAGPSRAKVWIDDPAELPRITGHDTLAVLLRLGADLDAAWLAGLVARIEADVDGSPNRVRYAMNHVLIAIGGYRPDLRETVVAAAGRIGPIYVDHGDTGCVTPAIVPSIERIGGRAARRTRPRGRARTGEGPYSSVGE